MVKLNPSFGVATLSLFRSAYSISIGEVDEIDLVKSDADTQLQNRELPFDVESDGSVEESDLSVFAGKAFKQTKRQDNQYTPSSGNAKLNSKLSAMADTPLDDVNALTNIQAQVTDIAEFIADSLEPLDSSTDQAQAQASIDTLLCPFISMAVNISQRALDKFESRFNANDQVRTVTATFAKTMAELSDATRNFDIDCGDTGNKLADLVVLYIDKLATNTDNINKRADENSSKIVQEAVDEIIDNSYKENAQVNKQQIVSTEFQTVTDHANDMDVKSVTVSSSTTVIETIIVTQSPPQVTRTITNVVEASEINHPDETVTIKAAAPVVTVQQEAAPTTFSYVQAPEPEPAPEPVQEPVQEELLLDSSSTTPLFAITTIAVTAPVATSTVYEDAYSSSSTESTIVLSRINLPLTLPKVPGSSPESTIAFNPSLAAQAVAQPGNTAIPALYYHNPSVDIPSGQAVNVQPAVRPSNTPPSTEEAASSEESPSGFIDNADGDVITPNHLLDNIDFGDLKDYGN